MTGVSPIRVNFLKNNAGYNGELELDYHLRFLSDSYITFPGLRLHVDGYVFQMDTLIISSNATFIIESKNMDGELHFDSVSGQVTRKSEFYNGGIPNPILQAQRQHILFKKWLKKHLNRDIPCHYLVAISSPETVVT